MEIWDRNQLEFHSETWFPTDEHRIHKENKRFPRILPDHWYAGPVKICWTFPGSEGISGNPMYSPKFPGIFREISGILRNFPKRSQNSAEFSDILQGFPRISRDSPLWVWDFRDFRNFWQPAGWIPAIQPEKSFWWIPRILKNALSSKNDLTEYKWFPSEISQRGFSPQLEPTKESLTNFQNKSTGNCLF